MYESKSFTRLRPVGLGIASAISLKKIGSGTHREPKFGLRGSTSCTDVKKWLWNVVPTCVISGNVLNYDTNDVTYLLTVEKTGFMYLYMFNGYLFLTSQLFWFGL
jgi:hypothetical protein